MTSRFGVKMHGLCDSGLWLNRSGQDQNRTKKDRQGAWPASRTCINSTGPIACIHRAPEGIRCRPAPRQLAFGSGLNALAMPKALATTEAGLAGLKGKGRPLTAWAQSTFQARPAACPCVADLAHAEVHRLGVSEVNAADRGGLCHPSPGTRTPCGASKKAKGFKNCRRQSSARSTSLSPASSHTACHLSSITLT